MPAAKITEIGDVPLDVELIFHRRMMTQNLPEGYRRLQHISTNLVLRPISLAYSIVPWRG